MDIQLFPVLTIIIKSATFGGPCFMAYRPWRGNSPNHWVAREFP